MESFKKDIIYYKKDNGEYLFKSWIDGLKDKVGLAIIKSRIQRVRRGNLGDCKSLGDGIFELKIKYGPGYRVYYAHLSNELILLISGGNKKTQSRDIIEAKKYLKDYRRQHDKEKS